MGRFSRDLLRITNASTKKPDIRSAAFNTLGLLERRKDSGSAETALRYFLQALGADPMPDTCFYIAEILLERNQTAEAARYLKNAIRLCPEHAGALALQDHNVSWRRIIELIGGPHGGGAP